MENKEFTDIACAWTQYRERLESARCINRKALELTLVSRSFWLAPCPMLFYVIVGITLMLAIVYCIVIYPGYWPVPALCLFGIVDMAWQHEMRNRIRRLDGGVVGMQRNLLIYRKCYVILSVVVFLVIIPYFWWIGRYMGYFVDSATVFKFLVVLAVISASAFVLRTYKTFRALGDLNDLASQLREIRQAD